MRLKGRKGFAYLVSATLIILVVIFTFVAVQQPRHVEQQEKYEPRIRMVNDFVRSINTDLERASFISAFRTLMALENHISIQEEANFFDSLDESFRETFVYGTINGEQVALMNDTSIKDYLERVNLIAGTMGVKVDMNITSVHLEHYDPWHIHINIVTLINISDIQGTVYWEYEEKTQARLPIYNLRDPLYTVNMEEPLYNTIRRFNETYFVSDENDTGNLEAHINGSYYIESEDAPSFLMRFEGNNSGSPHGIESIVNIDEIGARGLTVYPDRIKIDFIYFNNFEIPGETCEPEEVDSKFRLIVPESRYELYNLTGLC